MILFNKLGPTEFNCLIDVTITHDISLNTKTYVDL